MAGGLLAGGCGGAVCDLDAEEVAFDRDEQFDGRLSAVWPVSDAVGYELGDEEAGGFELLLGDALRDERDGLSRGPGCFGICRERRVEARLASRARLSTDSLSCSTRSSTNFNAAACSVLMSPRSAPSSISDRACSKKSPLMRRRCPSRVQRERSRPELAHRCLLLGHEVFGEQHRCHGDAKPGRNQAPAVGRRLCRFHLPQTVGRPCDVEFAGRLCLADPELFAATLEPLRERDDLFRLPSFRSFGT